MNILEHIFKIENPKLEYKISEGIYDLLFDWFNESKISVSAFETDFFEPLITAFRTQENENKYFEGNFEQARRSYYLRFAFLYLIGKYPNNTLLKRLFALKTDIYDFHRNLAKWYPPGNLVNQFPDLFRPLEIGSHIADYYHAIFARIDQNISYLPSNFASLKFKNDKQVFTAVFDYVNSQTFEEKPYLLFLLLKSTTLNPLYEIDENGKYIDKGIEVISVSPNDKAVELAFENSLKEYNQLYNAHLNKESFLLLKAFLSFKQIDKKAKLTIDNFEEAKTMVQQAKGNEIDILDHIIYYIKNEYLYEQDRYWQILLTAICENLVCPAEWIKNKILLLLSKKDTTNAHLIFKYTITPLFQNISPTLNYSDAIVQNYESLLFKRTKKIPYQKGLDILRTIAANTISNAEEKIFVLSKYGQYYYLGQISEYSSLAYDEKDKNFTTIKAFVEDLNTLAPVALKKVIKQTYNNYDEEISFVINHAGKDISISRSYFTRDINKFLASINSPYRLVAIPLIVTEPDWNGYRSILFSIAFMNQKEQLYFKDHYLNLNNWFSEEQLQWIKDDQVTFEIFTPGFTVYSEIPFAEIKNTSPSGDLSIANKNAFLSDINWEWFKVKYIDELSSKEQWYEIMNVICNCPKGKKPTPAWLSDLRIAIEKLGFEKYFKELQVLFSLSLKEESWFFDNYANSLKGLIWSCAYIAPNDLSLSILKTIIEFSYAKIPGVGAKSTIIGNVALEALTATQKEEAFGILNIMRNKTKYNKFVVALEKSIDKFKESSTLPEQLLADKSIPTFGFNEGSKIFEIADHKIIVNFQKKKLSKSYVDKDGNSLKQLPAQITTDYAKPLKEINEEIKQINSVFTDLSNRIKTYWLYDRTWRFSDWSGYIKNNDLIYPHIESLIWTNITQHTDYIVLDNRLLDITNREVTPNPDDEIRLWHPVLNNENNISQWQDYLWTNKIVQSQRQAFRENYPFSTTELDLTETPRFAHHFLEVRKLMAIANTAGWIFTYVHEGVNWPRVYLKPLNITVHLNCDYDRYSFAIPTKQIYFTRDNSTKINDYKPKQHFEKIKLHEIPIVTLSEVCRDIDLFIATTSIANNLELSENRQEYDAYRTEYQKGLFSDNANAKIRKQILEKIAPVLKLNIENFEGNYVIIKGKSETYKINLNSGFAQSNETQKHINLIPDIKKIKSDKKLRIPIEDDETLYIILAKIMYLQTL